MRRKKALGQDPLAWIKLTQERAAEEEAPPDAAVEAPAPAERPATMNWAFLIIYILNMFLLLALVFLVHRDLGQRVTAMENEVKVLRGRLRAIQETGPLPPGGRRTPPE